MTDNRPGTGRINCEAPFKLGGRRRIGVRLGGYPPARPELAIRQMILGEPCGPVADLYGYNLFSICSL